MFPKIFCQEDKLSLSDQILAQTLVTPLVSRAATCKAVLPIGGWEETLDSIRIAVVAYCSDANGELSDCQTPG